MTSEILYKTTATSSNAFIVDKWNDLTNPVYSSLNGYHHEHALTCGTAIRYNPEISVFAAIAAADQRSNWEDLAQIVAPGETVLLTFPQKATVPVDMFRVEQIGLGYRFLGDKVKSQFWENNHAGGTAESQNTREYRLRRLTVEDNSQIVELFSSARPGPFFSRTVTMGKFFGLFHDDRLIAVVGQRLFPGDFIEISGVSTHPEYQRQGLASRLIKHAVADIKHQDKIPFLHFSSENHTARKVYEKLGFHHIREVYFHAITLL